MSFRVSRAFIVERWRTTPSVSFRVSRAFIVEWWRTKPSVSFRVSRAFIVERWRTTPSVSFRVSRAFIVERWRTTPSVSFRVSRAFIVERWRTTPSVSFRVSRGFIVERWRTTPSVSFRVSRVLKHLLSSTHINTCHHVAIVDCTHVGSATASLKDLATVAPENCTNQTADVLVGDQLQPPSRTWQQFPRRENHIASRTEWLIGSAYNNKQV